MTTIQDVLANAMAGDSVNLEKSVEDMLQDKVADHIDARRDELEKEMLGDEGEPNSEDEDGEVDEDNNSDDEAGDNEDSDEG